MARCNVELVVVVVYLLAATILRIANAQEFEYPLPEFLKICHRDDPNLNDCVMESVEHLKPYLKEGIPELGIPSCEPLHIPEIVINQGRGAVSVQSTYSDILVSGPSEFDLKSVRLDLNKQKVKLKIHIPALRVTSKYTMEGRILLLPIQGNGIGAGNYTDIDATCSVLGETVNRKGWTYYNVKEFNVSFNIGHASVLLDDLFNGDKEMGDAMNTFLNENWRNVAQEIRPVMEDTIGEIFKTFCNKIYHKYPLEQLLPP
ncbi:protein takeout [Anabrus simplex]|uniref:protein takeout n=1 Tax=Anabrus simplex TaxID=316456 RepID=UPI0035A3AA00